MKQGQAFNFFNIMYAFGLVCFLILFYFNIKIIFLTNLLIITSLALLIIKLKSWLENSKNIRSNDNNDTKKTFLLKLIFCIFAYINPIYCIIQEPYLVVSHNISVINLGLVIILSIIGLLIGRWYLL
tara:strand:+ start:1561 stop:1941 length:381 start_codon:yes stop_codon:yes gene_type:complete